MTDDVFLLIQCSEGLISLWKHEHQQALKDGWKHPTITNAEALLGRLKEEYTRENPHA